MSWSHATWKPTLWPIKSFLAFKQSSTLITFYPLKYQSTTPNSTNNLSTRENLQWPINLSIPLEKLDFEIIFKEFQKHLILNVKLNILTSQPTQYILLWLWWMFLWMQVGRSCHLAKSSDAVHLKHLEGVRMKVRVRVNLCL